MRVKVSSLKENPNNPRFIRDSKFEKLVKSIQDFPEMLSVRKLVVNKDYVVLGGNMRLKAIKEAGVKEVEVEVVEWSEEKEKEFIIKDNLGYGEWDFEMLANEWEVESLTEWGLDIPGLTLPDITEELEKEDSPYSEKILTPIYEPSDEKPKVESLYDSGKYNKLVEEINSANLSKEEKKFLLLSASRHIVFNYSKIADFYSHSSEEAQSLMEKSALVIIDSEKAIENGFVRLSKQLEEIIDNE